MRPRRSVLWAGVGVAIVGLLAWTLRNALRAEASPAPPAVTTPVGEPGEPTESTAAPVVPERRTAAESGRRGGLEPVANWKPAIPRSSQDLLRGVVLDADSKPMAGVPLADQLDPSRVLAASDATGQFEFALPAGREVLRVVAADGPFVTLAAGTFDGRSRATPQSSAEAVSPCMRVVCAHRVMLSGRIVDADGEGLAGAQIETRLDYLEDVLAVGNARRLSVSGRSLTDGRFEVYAPGVAG